MNEFKKLRVLLDQCCGTCANKSEIIQIVDVIEKKVNGMHYQECLWEKKISSVTGGCDTPEEAAQFIKRVIEQAQLS